MVIITGGAGLLGQEFANSIIQNGGTAIITDIDNSIGEKVKNNLSFKFKTNKIDYINLDITSKSSIQGAVRVIDRKYGRIDALVNNAYPRNKNFGGHFFAVDYHDFCENISLNLGGYFLASQQLATYFKNNGGGNIVNISSIYGIIAPKFEIYKDTAMTMPIEYAAIKSALINLTRYMAKYFKDLNIRVNAISPGGILDNQPEEFLIAYKAQCLNKGMLNGVDVTGTLIYLLSDMSKYVNGQNIIVDDGFSI